MAKRKAKSRADTAQVSHKDSDNKVHSVDAESGFFPFARYTSVVGVHTNLLAFSALFLPRSVFFVTTPDLTPASSRDKPQHPFLDPLTINPAWTLACICGGAIILQGWWGGWVRKWSNEFTLKGSDDEKRFGRSILDQRKNVHLRNAWLTTLAMSFIFHIVLVLFGAPISSHLLQSYLLALLFSLLTVFVPAYTLGPPSLASDSESLVRRLTWIRLFAELSPRNPIERAIVYPAAGAALGCWAGVIPIALDWDRPWQAWPLTPAFGATLGYITGSLWAVTFSLLGKLAAEHIQIQRAEKGKTS